MSKSVNPIRWSDEVVARVLLAPPGAVAAICREIGLSPSVAKSWRGLRQQRALRIAQRLGLPYRDPMLCTWEATGR